MVKSGPRVHTQQTLYGDFVRIIRYKVLSLGSCESENGGPEHDNVPLSDKVNPGFGPPRDLRGPEIPKAPVRSGNRCWWSTDVDVECCWFHRNNIMICWSRYIFGFKLNLDVIVLYESIITVSQYGNRIRTALHGHNFRYIIYIYGPKIRTMREKEKNENSIIFWHRYVYFRSNRRVTMAGPDWNASNYHAKWQFQFLPIIPINWIWSLSVYLQSGPSTRRFLAKQRQYSTRHLRHDLRHVIYWLKIQIFYIGDNPEITMQSFWWV